MQEVPMDKINIITNLGPKGQGTPLGDAKDQLMRTLADSSITELAHEKPSSSRTTSEMLGAPTNESKIVMLARNKELKGVALKNETIAAIDAAHKRGAKFVVGDMPGVDEPFVRHLEKIGAQFELYSPYKKPRFEILKPHTISEQKYLDFSAYEKTLGPDPYGKLKNSSIDQSDLGIMDLPEGYEPSIIDDSIVDDDYFASLENTLENYPDYDASLGSLADEADGLMISDQMDQLSKPVKRPKSGQKLTALETVVDELTEGGPKSTRAMPEYERKIKSVIEQGIDLIGQISNDVTKTRSGITGTAGALAGEAKSTLLSSDTTQNIIKSMSKAMEVVKGASTAKKVGYTLGGLGAIGALSGRTREDRKR